MNYKEFIIQTIVNDSEIFSFFAISKYTQKIQDALYFDVYTNLKHLYVAAISILLFVLSVSSITSSGFNPFIYFRF